MISQQAFDAVTAMFHRVSGIQLTTAKRALVTGRLQKLAQARGIGNVDRYVEMLLDENDPDELVRVVDKLTTNETYFFREPEHFEFLARMLGRRSGSQPPFRVWSAASSSGEEAYSIAMLLADHLGPRGWEVVGTDLSTAMVDAARRALYPLERARQMPQAYLKRYCLRGMGEYEGQLLISRDLRANVRFTGANLMESLPDLGTFDVIFLRNVLIYFDPPAKEAIAGRVIGKLKRDGYLFTGHAESLTATRLPLRSVQPAVYELA
ncbi:MAG: protein-glutamate O-methyltransferase CheR [Burkholderiaceae bacterium]|jgi:chemotaxis protein methyltransferase CheR|nr:protein-glutamate O-methyltransferase CheR [Aquabacterium sp.]NUP86606.1 protein-glutamate O-methyltransferase CheR [Burkholderiaceae bacterium]